VIETAPVGRRHESAAPIVDAIAIFTGKRTVGTPPAGLDAQ
jgi:hypothetical protein